MSDHYYSEKPTVKSERKKITETITNDQYTFYVDRGIFSKTGLDFGSRLLIESFELPNVVGTIVDVGCGWGPISISLAKRNPNIDFIALDINERAVKLTEENVKLNGVTNLHVMQSNLLEGHEGKYYSAIITNPPIRAGKNTVFKLYEQAANALVKNGEIWIVIQKKQGAPSTIAKLEDLGFDVEVIKKSKGYYIIRGKKC
ncbi:class I SAM-dependent methyltransferase [Evansella cellulosilytica]|uniref:Methyltransferase small n=1 Tax=Evansella cellulosilytica (strain ATCC 21833 / DSM 2522 / FERM P-1141 / JCM 9156 / N-4) TaxID=649639 RepID=E6TSI3_EVAC2|nr:class I SAM-dependent methyltransferase [Evansella cellulosilytica]ADU28398.1 methyltransferase small [Evansella cellulosilytica DSM 2522]